MEFAAGRLVKFVPGQKSSWSGLSAKTNPQPLSLRSSSGVKHQLGSQLASYSFTLISNQQEIYNLQSTLFSYLVQRALIKVNL